MDIKIESWGFFKNTQVNLYNVENENIKISLSNFGAMVQSIFVRDKNGNFIDIVLGYDALEDYLTDKFYFGVIPAIYANRINNATFTSAEETIFLDKNQGEHALHAGGIGKEVWGVDIEQDNNNVNIIFSILIDDSFKGFPSGIQIKVIYSIYCSGEFTITYEAITEKNTIINLTNHTYFNLGEHDILSHYLTINSNYILPTNSTGIPTGELRSVYNTPFDFTEPRPIKDKINSKDQQISFGNGYDVNYIVSKQIDARSYVTHPSKKNEFIVYNIATLKSDYTGIILKIKGSQPGVQLYSGNYLDGVLGKNKNIYFKHKGLCLETQHYPDSPNHISFPSVFLSPLKPYQHIVSYCFTVDKQ